MAITHCNDIHGTVPLYSAEALKRIALVGVITLPALIAIDIVEGDWSSAMCGVLSTLRGLTADSLVGDPLVFAGRGLFFTHAMLVFSDSCISPSLLACVSFHKGFLAFGVI